MNCKINFGDNNLKKLNLLQRMPIYQNLLNNLISDLHAMKSSCIADIYTIDVCSLLEPTVPQQLVLLVDLLQSNLQFFFRSHHIRGVADYHVYWVPQIQATTDISVHHEYLVLNISNLLCRNLRISKWNEQRRSLCPLL